MAKERRVIGDKITWLGTAAERAAEGVAGFKGEFWLETDTGYAYFSTGLAWDPAGRGGASLSIPTVDIHTGTTATRTGLSLGATDYGYPFWDTDLSALYAWYGNTWDLYPKWTAGAAMVADGAVASGPIYGDATYKYFGEAAPGTALTAASWRVSRMKIADSQIQWADGNGNFDNVFTSLAVVAALSYL